MRILRLRFKNLNSLVGEWEIDLTHPSFASDGIFAITGPTGSGKTTILDAICLALYGRTPRLNKITKSGNEIMSRQTGECFAEVTFETQTGRYRCHWSQHRARKKPGGELQPPKHEIADADSGRIFEAKIRGVADQIETTTGMDFDRFTRSMLLAQGGFAAFLQAPPDDRAPILEQITGTEIYSQISVRVHERRFEERKQLETLQVALAGMPLLNQEEEQQLAEGLARQVRQEAELAGQIAETNQAVTWTEGVARLEQDLKDLLEKKGELQIRLETFAPEQERLRRAHQALELAADHAALTAIRKEQETDKDSLHLYRESLPSRTDAARQAQERMKATVEQLGARKTEQQKTLPILRNARELDLKIAEKDLPIKAANHATAELSTSIESIKTKQEGDYTALASKRKALEQLQGRLEACRADEALIEHLAGLRGRFESLTNSNAQLVGKLDEIAQADKQFQQALSVWHEQRTSLENEKRGLAGLQNTLAERQAELLKILANQEMADWRKSQSQLTAQKDLIAKAVEAAQTLSASNQIIDALGCEQTALSAEELALTQTLATQSERQAALEKEMGLLETQLTLQKRIEDLEEDRHQLEDGEPCPLCGAMEHPFAQGNIPILHTTQLSLATVRTDLKSLTDTIAELKVRQARASKDLERIASGQREHSGKIDAAQRLIGALCSELPSELQLTVPGPGFVEKLKSLQEEITQRLIHATSTLQSAESVDRALASLRNSVEDAKDLVRKIEREAQHAEHKKESAGQLLERLKKEADGFRDQQTATLVHLHKEVQFFGIKTLAIDELNEVLAQLTRRRDQWLARQKEKIEFEQTIAALEIQTRHQAEHILQKKNELKKQREQRGVLLQEQQVLVQARQDMFGDNKVDHEEARLARAIESADQEVESARKKLATADQELSQLKTKINEQEKAVAIRELQLESGAEAFLRRLEDAGFTDEENYTLACLAEDERKHLAQLCQRLADEKTEITSQEREKTRLLETERQKHITEESLEDLKNILVIRVGKQKDLHQEIGGMRQKLKDNQSLKRQQQQRVQAVEAQKRECVRWDMLHELIGSADGKKYRNFAQGLTFELMVGHANRQLQKMTDRYLVIRDEVQPLELNVIDNYQAGEIRSTKNLSGGESFIVSLSLALGLSHMASKNVRVDSLFLDEGFGTLDEEALDTALETLAGLQQDGKLIGIISHVPALKERISTQIQVDPQTGGKSRISGPGCARLNASPRPG